MATAILQIIASIASLVGAWALMKFIILPWYQKYQSMFDTAANNKAKQDASNQNQAANNQDQSDAAKRGDIWDSLNPPASSEKDQ